MNQDFVYLDSSATTLPCEKAKQKLNECLDNNWGNPSSLHLLGVNSEILLSDTRVAVAKMLGCGADEIYFTSGGTESNNLAIIGVAEAKKRVGNKIITTEIEHSSVLETCKYLESKGFKVVYLKPNEQGTVDILEFEKQIDESTILVSSMLINNETGAILPVEKIKSIIKQKNSPALLHCDCVQGFGKIKISVKNLKADLISISAHKIHGIKGTGVLYKDKNVNINPIIFGGGQEKNIRSGTEGVPGVAAMLGALAELNIEKNYQKVLNLNAELRKRLSEVGDVLINSPDSALPYILNFSVLGYRSETLLHFLENEGIYVSSGSACSKGKGSYVLNAMGLSKSRVDSALRISFSRYNSSTDIEKLVTAINNAKLRLRKSKI